MIVLVLFVFIALIAAVYLYGDNNSQITNNLNDEINIPIEELWPMASDSIAAFRCVHPDANVKIFKQESKNSQILEYIDPKFGKNFLRFEIDPEKFTTTTTLLDNQMLTQVIVFKLIKNGDKTKIGWYENTNFTNPYLGALSQMSGAKDFLKNKMLDCITNRMKK